MTVEEIMQRIRDDRLLTELRNKIQYKNGGFGDTADYSNRAAELLGSLFSESVLEMPPESRQEACIALLRDRYDDIVPLLDEVQKRLDRKNGLTIAPQHAPFNKERAAKIGTSLTDETVPDRTIKRRAASAPATMTRAMQDEYIRKNAGFRAKAGLKCRIVRETDGNCCEWCSSVAGRYEYGSEPDGVYHRHDNCGCTVTYESGRQRQNVWSKQSWEVPEEGAGAPEPKVFSKEEARSLEESKLSDLTMTGQGGIIESLSKQQDYMDREHKEHLSAYEYDPKKGVRVLKKWSIRINPMGKNSNIYSQTYSKDAQAMAEYLNQKVNNGDYGKVDRIIIVKNVDLRGISSYRQMDNTLFISEELITKKGFDRLVDKSYFPARNLDDVIIHELAGHKRHWDMVKKFHNDNLDKYSSLEDAKQDYERSLRGYVIKQQISDYFYISKNVSMNAFNNFDINSSLNELIADCTVMYRNNAITDNGLFDLVEELMKYDAQAE